MSGRYCFHGHWEKAVFPRIHMGMVEFPSTITLGSSQLFNHASTLHDQKKQLNSENKILSLLLPVLLQCRSLAPLPSIRCLWLSRFLCGATGLYFFSISLFFVTVTLYYNWKSGVVTPPALFCKLSIMLAIQWLFIFYFHWNLGFFFLLLRRTSLEFLWRLHELWCFWYNSHNINLPAHGH